MRTCQEHFRWRKPTASLKSAQGVVSTPSGVKFPLAKADGLIEVVGVGTTGPDTPNNFRWRKPTASLKFYLPYST